MVMSLIYGADATGKSVQCKTFCELDAETALYISLEVKDRRLIKKSSEEFGYDYIESVILEKPPSYEINRVASLTRLGKEVIEHVLNGKSPLDKTTKKKYTTVVIDSITELPKWAEAVVLAEIRKKHPEAKTIGKENLAGWAARNNLAALPLERLAMWATDTGARVYATTHLADIYVNEVRMGTEIDVKRRIRDLADVRVQLLLDGRGYTCKFEKVPDWADVDGVPPVNTSIKMAKGGLAGEFGKRGLLE